MTTIHLPAAQFADAWRTVWTCVGDDDGQPQLYRTVYIELHGEGVRLVATDTYMLVAAWLGFEDYSPPIKTEPDKRWIVVDHDARVKAMCSWLAKSAKDDAEMEITLTDGQLVDDRRPTLAPFLERNGVTIDAGTEQVGLYQSEASPIDWRGLLKLGGGEATERLALGADMLGRFAAMKLADPVRFSLSGDTKPARWASKSPASHPVDGLLMPIRER